MNSHSSGWIERVTRSSWSWRSLRSSAWAIATVPASRRSGADALSEGGGPGSAEATGDAPGTADIAQPPSGLHLMAGDDREDLLELADAVLAQQRLGLALLDEVAVVDDRQALAVALGLLHQVRGDDDRRARALAQRMEALPHQPSRRRVQADGGLVEEQHARVVEQRAGDLQAAQHAAGEVAG